MREAFQNDLQVLHSGLIEMCELVAESVQEASAALLTGDLARAEAVIAADHRIDERQVELDERAVDILARQAPVATDLRTVVASLRMSASLERMGDLAEHIALVLRRRHPREVLPEDMRPIIEKLAELTVNAIRDTRAVLESYDLAAAAVVEERDDRIDEVMGEVYQKLSASGADYSVKEAVDLALLARFYERLGDHAVSVVRRVSFLVTGDSLDPHSPRVDVDEI